MTALGDANQQDLWDTLDERLQKRWAGNLDPWAGPVDPRAQKRWEARHRADVTSWRAQREQDACGCWMADCDECLHRVGDGQRPTHGQVRRFVLNMTVNRVRVLARIGGV